MASFYETIFLKEDSSFENKLNTIDKQLYDKSDIYKLEKGMRGEQQVAYHLKKTSIGMFALRDINFSCDDMNAQVDFIVVTSHHCYFIECKNYSDDIIHVDEHSNFEISKKVGNKYIKQGIKSPLSQADDQLNVFKKLCLNNPEEIKKILNGVKFKDYFKTLVVFTNQDNRLDLKKAPNDIKYKILKVDNLIRQMEYDQSHYEGKILSKEEIESIANYILSCHVEKNIDEISLPLELKKNKKSNGRRNFKSNNKKSYSFKEQVFNLLFVLCFLLVFYFVFNDDSQKDEVRLVDMSDNQKKAVEIMKSAYEDSSQNGFTIIHTSVCNEISNMFDGSKFSCSKNPLEVNFITDIKFTIYKNYWCYTIELSEDGEKIKSIDKYSKGYVENNHCKGVSVGVVEWDNENEYYQKIGGYSKLLEIARFNYSNNTNVDSYFQYDDVESRGGNTKEILMYSQTVNKYFAAVTGRGYISHSNSTNKDETNKMCEAFYYIMKN